MQVVRDAASMPEAAQRAMRLAQANFGDARLILERYIERPRHIEVQVFGDSHGNIVHLFERECSLQRRHQKVVEEAPAPRLAPHLRQELHEAAVRGARAVGYVNAGTFEFIVGAEGDIHFLEVNTRLQVEHPVTEAITGIDLVEWQLRVASGERLPMLQPEIAPQGHAFECRIYAEDPDNDFRPSPGKALHVGWPAGARVEAGIESGGEVSAFYDPMVGKLVTHGRTRDESLERMREAVRTTAILGLTTNLGYLHELLSDDNVADGNVHTRYLDERRMFGSSGMSACAVAAALSVRPSGSATWPWSPGNRAGAFDRAWLCPGSPLGKLWFRIGQDVLEAGLTNYTPGEAVVEVAGATYAVKMLDGERSGLRHGTVGDVAWYATPSEDFLEVALGGIRQRIERHGERVLAQHASVESAVAPMPGIVVALAVNAGDEVRAGDVLVVVESMKMENQIRAGSDGKVAQVNCQLNETVTAGQVLVSVEPASS
jgi:propionyl-CoA carboxylase alpha chain/3-methylcrotonyl-CoA carboxylase alpha subunit